MKEITTGYYRIVNSEPIPIMNESDQEEINHMCLFLKSNYFERVDLSRHNGNILYVANNPLRREIEVYGYLLHETHGLSEREKNKSAIHIWHEAHGDTEAILGLVKDFMKIGNYKQAHIGMEAYNRIHEVYFQYCIPYIKFKYLIHKDEPLIQYASERGIYTDIDKFVKEVMQDNREACE